MNELVQANRTLELTRSAAVEAERSLAASQELVEQAARAAESLAQPDFFDNGEFGWELAALDKPETRHGKYTGAQLEERIAVRDAVVRMLAEGCGIRRIARQMRESGVKIGERSIMAFAERRPDLVATEKKRLGQQLSRITKLMADSIEDRLINGTMKPNPVDLAIIIDKKASVDGEANLVIEHRFTMDASADAFAKRLAEMKKAKVSEVRPAVESDSSVIDVKPQ
jgi:hypothetical protein